MEERCRERHGRGTQLPSPCWACPPPRAPQPGSSRHPECFSTLPEAASPPRGSPPRSRGFPSDQPEQKVRCEPQGPLVNNQRQSYHSGDAKGFRSSVPGTRTKATRISFRTVTALMQTFVSAKIC